MIELLGLVPLAIDAAVDWLYQERREMPADPTAAWQCVEGVCVDVRSVQKVGNLVYFTAKEDGRHDQMFITLDCLHKKAAVTQGRYRDDDMRSVLATGLLRKG